jgi:hypothetical protein
MRDAPDEMRQSQDSRFKVCAAVNPDSYDSYFCVEPGLADRGVAEAGQKVARSNGTSGCGGRT